MKALSLLIAISAALSSCDKPGGLSPISYINVPYGTSAAQKMDVYLPEGRSTTSTKVLILIHGGGWSSGDKGDFTQYLDTLKKRLPGYAIFNINYRLATSGSNLFPIQENDVKAAIEFINARREEYKISDKFALLGVSAGAHLSLLHAYKNETPVKIKAVVDFFGPTDIVDMYNNPASPAAPPALVAAVAGGTPAAVPAIYQSSSPINYVSVNSTPTIILQGGVDILVSPSQSVALKNKLVLNGVSHAYVFYPTENHGWVGANMIDSFDKIVAFLAQYVN